jgi:hypothetical protein
MATKKKAAKRPKKKAPSRRKSPVHALPVPLPFLPETPAAPSHFFKGSVGLALALALCGLGIYFATRPPQVEPEAHKVAAGVQIEAAPSAQAQPAPTPQKRSSSPDSPRVWDRQKTKAAARFYILRDQDGIAEIRVFRAGNISIRDIQSDKGPKKTVVLRWDGKDESGADVAAGTYYVRISGAHGDIVEEILIK